MVHFQVLVPWPFCPFDISSFLVQSEQKIENWMLCSEQKQKAVIYFLLHNDNALWDFIIGNALWDFIIGKTKVLNIKMLWDKFKKKKKEWGASKTDNLD